MRMKLGHGSTKLLDEAISVPSAVLSLTRTSS